MTTMDKKTVLVVSRHPHLEDVRKRILEEAGYEVISIRNPEQIEKACKDHKPDLTLVGYSLTPAEKRRIAVEALAFCKCPILELWDREPPRVRIDPRISDHYSLTPEDFLDAVNRILRRNSSK